MIVMLKHFRFFGWNSLPRLLRGWAGPKHALLVQAHPPPLTHLQELQSTCLVCPGTQSGARIIS